MRIALSLLFALTLAGPSSAAVIAADTWYGFSWNPVNGSPVAGSSDPGSPAWTINNASTLYLVIADGFSSGDQFEAFDNAVSLGQTTLVPTGFSGCSGGDSGPNCLADTNFSSGVFALAPGSHSLAFTLVQDPFNGGGAFFAVLSTNPSAAPEPSTFALLGLGVAGAFAVRRRR